MAGRFNPREAWDALTPEMQREIGPLALLLVVSSDANQDDDIDGQPDRHWEATEIEAWDRLGALVPDYRDYPDGPDLAMAGIAVCRRCGCSDALACPGGCAWVDEDLCSSCARAPA